MISRSRILAGGAAALLVVVVGAWTLFTGVSPADAAIPHGHSRTPAPPRFDADRGPDSFDIAAAPARGLRVGEVATPMKDAKEWSTRARALVDRLSLLRSSDPGVPDDVRDAVLAFLGEGPGARDALFALAWAQGTPGIVRGRLIAVLADLPASEREAFMAALARFDPAASIRDSMTDLAGDSGALARWIESTGDPTERASKLRQVPRESVSDAEVSAALRRIASDDPSEAVRVESLWLLASSRAEGVPAFLAEHVGNEGRSSKERRAAAYSLGIHHDTIPGEALVDLHRRLPTDLGMFLYRSLGLTEGVTGVDDALLAGIADSEIKARRLAAIALGQRIERLPADAGRDLAERTSTLIRTMSEEAAQVVLSSLATAVASQPSLSQVAAELHRASRDGGPIRTAVASSPILRKAVGL